MQTVDCGSDVKDHHCDVISTIGVVLSRLWHGIVDDADDTTTTTVIHRDDCCGLVLLRCFLSEELISWCRVIVDHLRIFRDCLWGGREIIPSFSRGKTMSGYRKVNYYELCRLCTSSEGNKMNIFRDEGRRRQLQTKIQTYLPIQVSVLICAAWGSFYA